LSLQYSHPDYEGWAQNIRILISGVGLRVSGFGVRILGGGSRTAAIDSIASHFPLEGLDFVLEFRAPDFGFRAPGFGFRILGVGERKAKGFLARDAIHSHGQATRINREQRVRVAATPSCQSGSGYIRGQGRELAGVAVGVGPAVFQCEY